MLDIFVTSRVRRKIIVVFAKYPDFKTHVRGLAKLIKEDPGNIQRELTRMTEGKFLIMTKKGNTRIYQTNKQFPILKELQSIVIKSQKGSKQNNWLTFGSLMNKLFEQLIKARGVTDDFLHPNYENLADPFNLPDMAAAVERITEAKAKGHHILIYGDYDVDGVTASTVLAETLRLAGIDNFEIVLPDRFKDGYGMNVRVVEFAKEHDVDLVITVDCGSRNNDIVEELKKLGIDTIVTDHHELAADLPKAVAVINPKRSDYKGFRDLAGVGVAFKLAQALVKNGLIKSGQEKWLLDLVAIGTICDSMPVIDENRILVYFGMTVLKKTRRVGLKELMKKTGTKIINTDAIGFQIGPRLNAAGRLESPDIALNLLRTESNAEAARLAEHLDELNRQRKFEQQMAIDEIDGRGISDDPVIVEVGNYHEGILGIVAGKLVEKYHRPAFVLAKVGDNYKGSGRSFGDFNLASALEFLQGDLISGGGHAEAAGVKLTPENLEVFRQKINDYYKSLKLKDQERFLEIKSDLVVADLKDVSLELLDDLALLEPFGNKNEEPIFELKDMQVIEARIMTEKHLGLTLADAEDRRIKTLAFYAPEDWLNFGGVSRATVDVRLTKNEWNGTASVEGLIQNIKI